MNIRPSQIKHKQRIASFITHAVVATMGLLILSVLFQSYQISSRLMAQEGQRTSVQTSSLIQSLFDFRLAALKIHQDSTAKNASLTSALASRQSNQLDEFFSSVDELELSNAPDLRFIASNDEILWDDGNATFYGISPEEQKKLIRKVAISGNWHLVQTPSEGKQIHLLVRRSSLIEPGTGQVMGYLYVGIVLNDNFALVETIRSGSNSDNLVLAVDSTPLASTLKGNEPYSLENVLNSGHDAMSDSFIVGKTYLDVESVSTYLCVYSIQTNQNVLTLRDNFYFWIAFSLLMLVGVSIASRWWLQKRIQSEIETLMNYTHKLMDLDTKSDFEGSKIYEFDYFGRTLEQSFRRLANKEKQFEDLFNFALSPTMLWNTAGRLIRMNPSAQIQFLREDSQNHFLFEILEKQLLPMITYAAQGKSPSEVTTEVDGRVYRWNLSPIKVEGQIISIITQGQDVTSIAEAEKQSQVARREAEESARVRAEFLAKMSHELRTPLNGVLGVSQLLKRTPLTDEQREHVAVLCSSGEHLLAVLNDILDFSRLEQGKFRIQKSEFRLNELVYAIDRIYRPLCNDKGLELVVDSNITSAVLVRSDQVRINQILFNLLNNAIKFTHQGSIRVVLELIEGDPLAQLVIQVVDTGIGIREQDLTVIFEPFVQAESTTTREYGGSGLGLAIVHSLVEMLSGQLHVSSEYGRGTRFEIQLPIELVEAVAAPKQLAPPQEPYQLFDKPLRVLLVEDNHTNAFIAQAFCRKYGLDVSWVTDGLQALEELKQHRYDLVLMDNQLPYLDGVETTHTIKKVLNLPVVVYACTADGLEETRQAFFHAGAEFVLVKPLKEQTLHQALEHFKNQHLSQEEF
ncbi:quorum-sensing autoinducer 2 sensor kinase/phosphatase LuxQ [Vibrio sp. RC586]|uniref:quorum-sensing autoinducer 2 sensor kinase/phosphatase LuxQ n=1 Tax=Vibrio sp. RC586 TaxID=675815 RepID=UPI000311BCF4|nr:quorum-sensing autoinducer 2 sensor kinase/phosphatase LuxQ [Vibrio sp. RC586]